MKEIKTIDANHKMYNGDLYARHKQKGYYFCCRRRMRGLSLHRAVWSDCRGSIPEGYEIHHIDGDKGNCEISNLKMMRKGVHRRMHQLEKVGYEGEFKGRCIYCGRKIPEERTCAIFDTRGCKQRYYRRKRLDEVVRKCAECGEEFVTSKYKKSRVCKKCVGRLAARGRWGVKQG